MQDETFIIEGNIWSLYKRRLLTFDEACLNRAYGTLDGFDKVYADIREYPEFTPRKMLNQHINDKLYELTYYPVYNTEFYVLQSLATV